MAASGEQQKEEGHAAAAAKRRMAQPTKKARNVATGDKDPEFLGDPVPDKARAKWPQRYQRGSPMRCSLIVALLATSPLRSAQFRGRSLLCVRQRLSQKCRCRWTKLCFLAGNLSNLENMIRAWMDCCKFTLLMRDRAGPPLC